MYKTQNCRFVSRLVKKTMRQIINKAFPTVNQEVLLQNGPKNQCQYVSASAMKQFNRNKEGKNGPALGCQSVKEFAQKIVDNFYQNDVIKSISVHDNGFIRIKVKDQLVQQQVNAMIQDLSFPEKQGKKIVIDFSSPNIAKEMHVGHLRSTIIGESMSRVLQFMGNDVVRANHVGDWGTQFGMLIAYMKEVFPDYETKEPQIADLDQYYKAARKKFDSDPEFKKESQETVVRLQAYDETCIKAWKSICEVSRNYFSKIYQRLNIKLDQYGESFYNPYIPAMIKQLEAKNLIVQDSTRTKKGQTVEKKQGKKEVKKQQTTKQGQQGAQTKKQQKKGGKNKKQAVKKQKQESAEEQQQDFDLPEDGRKAKCIRIEGYQIPLIVVKSDGGYNYDTTDMACIQYRLHTLHADRIIYITDLGQREHFEMIFAAAKKAGWLTTQRVDHMGFGVVLGENKKKFSTRKGVSVKLLDLINEAHEKALAQLKSRQKQASQAKHKQKQGHEQEPVQVASQAVYTSLKPQQYEDSAEKLGIAGIKYYDLKQNRTSDYVFDFDKMLDPRGNTAVYLIYAYVRMCSIIRKSGMTSADIHQLAKKKPFVFTHPEERVLAGMLIKFFDVLNDSAQEMAINKITDYIYDVAVKVQENYKKYRIIGDQNMHSRIILVECVRKTLQKAFYMVGIVPIEKI